MPEFYPCVKTQRPTLLKSLFVFAFLISSHFLSSQPVINSFSPLAGPVGTTVTITGSNFSTTATNNTVFFGAVKAAVTAATSTSLTVTVPIGATYQPITVTTNGLTGYAKQAFNITFTSNGGLSASSFSKSDLATGDNPVDIAMVDVDGDGKSEVVVVHEWGNFFSVYPNNSTTGNVSFLSRIDVPCTSLSTGLSVADIDGDGKKDIIVGSNDYATGCWIFRNTSTQGTISFASQLGVGTSMASMCLSVTDVDGDGKPDIASPTILYSKLVSVLRNTSTPGNISFATRQDFPTGNYMPQSICMGDIDGDLKPDILAGSYSSSNTFSALRNTSTPGTISFAASQEFTTQKLSESFIIKDLDSDGKNEVIVANSINSTLVSVFKNTSTPGNISLGTRIDFIAGDFPQHVSMNDVDGDGNPDLLTANLQKGTISILKNNTSSGTISFGTALQFNVGGRTWDVQSGDLDGDLRPDIIASSRDDDKISVFASKGIPTLTGFTPSTGGTGTTVTITGTNLDQTTAVTIGGIPVTSFNIVSSTTITVVVAAGSKGTITVTTTTGTASIEGFAMAPTITSFSPTSGPIGTAVTITGNNFNTTATGNIVYFGAVKAQVTAATSTSLTVTVPTGATYQPITVTTNGFTGYAQQPFNVTFALSGGLLSSSYTKSELATGDTPTEVTMGDLDGDGKSDLVVLNYGANNFSIYQNNSTPGNLSFRPKVDYFGEDLNSFVTIADIDSDGKLDLLFGSESTSTGFWVYRNTSTAGTISFAPKISISGIYSNWLSVTDVDGDGKPDVTVPAYYDKLVSVYRNTSTPGNISFATKADFTVGALSAQTVYMGDLDGDRKPDLIAGGYVTTFSFSILRNTSTPGTISFATSQEVSTPRYSESFIIKDLDNDGKNELIVANGTGSTLVSVFKNTSTTGTVSLGARQDFVAGAYPQHMKMNDVDGDGLPDLLTANSDATTYSILKNTSASGTISFAAALQYESGDWPWDVQTGDLDGDRKPDNVVSCRGADKIVIFTSNSIPTLTGFTPTAGAGGTTVTLTGTNLDLATAVTIGGIPVTSFNIISSTTITAVIAAGSIGTITVSTLTGTASIDGFGQTPTIISFAPAAAPIGATVTITGSNFSATPSDNTVYFGTVKASVLSSTATTLTVKVPVGAAYQPISVTTNKLTAYSAIPFNVTFPGIGTAFAANSFSKGVNYISGYMPNDACIGDVDGDGKTDVIAANYGDNKISVFRNTSINGNISFATKADFAIDYPDNIAIADMDGDGKLDLVTSSASEITVFKNNCSPGTISFTNMGTFAHNNGVFEFVIADLDGDGKPDVALAGTDLTIMKNTSTGNTISFGAPVYFTVKNYQCVGISTGDIDGDGKPDIAITGIISAVNHDGWFSVFRNTMIPGAPFSSASFAAKIDYATNAISTVHIKIADLDADGKQDILAGNGGDGTMFVYKNTSTTGNISLATRISYNLEASTYNISVDDLDGDSKPDIIMPLRYDGVGLLKNNGTTGSVSMAPIVIYENAGEPYSSTSGDLDGDGKPDLIIANNSGDGFTVYRNQVAEPTVTPTGSSPVSGNIVNKLAIDGSVQLYNNTPYVQRHYDILPDNNGPSATATVTLYFTQQELNNFNATANHGADLPTTPTDATGIANLRIYQYHGTSAIGLPGSYTGSAVAIDPVDTKIVWNATTEWWEVTFDITGFSGFFASNATFNYIGPTAPIITAGSATTFCTGGSVTLTSSATSGNQWFKNGTVITNVTGTTLAVTTSGTYAVTATTNGATSALSTGIVVTVNTTPAKPTITRNVSQLISSASIGNQWYKDGALINGANTSTFTPTEAGNYSVIVTQNGCTSTESDKFNYTVTGVVNLDNNQFIRLSPNPVKDNIMLEYEMRGSPLLTIQIIDINGRICKTFTNKGTGSQLNMTELNNGVYIANIFTANHKQRYTIRLIKQ